MKDYRLFCIKSNNVLELFNTYLTFLVDFIFYFFYYFSVLLFEPYTARSALAYLNTVRTFIRPLLSINKQVNITISNVALMLFEK